MNTTIFLHEYELDGIVYQYEQETTAIPHEAIQQERRKIERKGGKHLRSKVLGRNQYA